jgi:hypothetical protein
LDAIVKFLYDLQSQGAMMDVRKLMMKPHGVAPQGGYLMKGRFSLTCAYTKEGVSTPTDVSK